MMKKLMLGLFSLLTLALLPAAQAGAPEAEVILQKAADFDAVVLQSKVPCLVDFYADWCPPCQKTGPILAQLAKTWAGKLKVVKVNVDKFPSLAEQYKVEGIPDVRVFSGGKQIEQYVGFQTEEEWAAIVAKLLQK